MKFFTFFNKSLCLKNNDLKKDVLVNIKCGPQLGIWRYCCSFCERVSWCILRHCMCNFLL